MIIICYIVANEDNDLPRLIVDIYQLGASSPITNHSLAGCPPSCSVGVGSYLVGGPQVARERRACYGSYGGISARLNGKMMWDLDKHRVRSHGHPVSWLASGMVGINTLQSPPLSALHMLETPPWQYQNRLDVEVAGFFSSGQQLLDVSISESSEAKLACLIRKVWGAWSILSTNVSWSAAELRPYASMYAYCGYIVRCWDGW